MSTHTARGAADLGAAHARLRFQPSRLTGVAFLVLFGAGLVISVLPPDVYSSAPDAWADAHGAEARVNLDLLASTFLFPLAGIFLVWAVARLRGVFRTGRGPDSMARDLALFGAGFTAIGMTIAAGAAAAASHAAAGAEGFTGDPVTGWGLAMLSGQVSNPVLAGLSVVLVAVSVGLRRARRLPGWLSWTAYILAPTLPVAWILGMIPLFLAVIWVAVVTAMVDTERHD